MEIYVFYNLFDYFNNQLQSLVNYEILINSSNFIELFNY